MAIPTDKPITGIPDPTKFGDPSSLPLGQVLPFVIQEHLARRAGKHFDVRLGAENMFSWATRKGMPLPGELQAFFQTPLHEESYMHYQGELPRGMYGAGLVRPVEKGSVIVHKAEPDKIVFTTAHTRYPQTYALLRKGNKPTDWMIRNLTAKTLQDFAGVDVSKEHYKSVPPGEIGKLYGTSKTFSEKIDGARIILKLKRDAVEAASYRESKTGYPIMHTQRLQLPRDLDIPSELVGTTLVGEAFGERVPETKSASYIGSHSKMIALRKARQQGKAPEKVDPKAHTGRDASTMQNGSFLARVVQMGKAGAVTDDAKGLATMLAREVAEEVPKVLNRLLMRKEEIQNEQEQPPQPILAPMPKIDHNNAPVVFSAPGSTEGVKVSAWFHGTQLFTGPKGVQSVIDNTLRKSPDIRESAAAEKALRVGADTAARGPIGGFANPGSGAAWIRRRGYDPEHIFYENDKYVNTEPAGKVTAPMSPREAIPHESFHAGPMNAWYRSVPGSNFLEAFIRSSERLARFRGGFALPKNKGFIDRLKSGYGKYKEFADVRPEFISKRMYLSVPQKLKMLFFMTPEQRAQYALSNAVSTRNMFKSHGMLGDLGKHYGRYSSLAEAKANPVTHRMTTVTETVPIDEMPPDIRAEFERTKNAESAGRVEPQVAKHPIMVEDTQPKKKKPVKLDSRAQLNDKIAQEKLASPELLKKLIMNGLRKREFAGVSWQPRIHNLDDRLAKLMDTEFSATVPQRLSGPGIFNKYHSLSNLANWANLSAKTAPERAEFLSAVATDAGLWAPWNVGVAEALKQAKVAHDGSFNATCGEPDGDVDVSMGHDTKRMSRKEWFEAIKNHRLKGPATMRLANTKHEKVSQDTIPVQELSGILNSSLAESLRKQQEQRVNMRVALFNILTKGKKPVGQEVPYSQKVELMKDILKRLPADKFLLPTMATTPEAQKSLWESIQAGKNPRTSEGVVVFPETGVPTKVKIAPEYDVIIRRMFPGAGKYEGVGAGGFEYSLPEKEDIIGRVGTGISDELRRDMMEHPEEYIGRTARIRAQGQYPSGAYRAPSLISTHEG